MNTSGEMLLFIRSPPASYCPLQISITSEILAIDIRRYSIAQPMRLETANYLGFLSLKTTTEEKKRKEEDEYWETWDSVKENGVGCRCKCDTDIVDVEGKLGSCLAEWVNVAGGWASPA